MAGQSESFDNEDQNEKRLVSFKCKLVWDILRNEQLNQFLRCGKIEDYGISKYELI